jgi:hypothetical protein
MKILAATTMTTETYSTQRARKRLAWRISPLGPDLTTLAATLLKPRKVPVTLKVTLKSAG